MKRILLISALVGVMFYACEEAESSNIIESTTECGDGSCIEALIADTSSVVIDSATVNNLLFLREEEKLARDVYLYLYDKWGLKVFTNISQSEQRHTDAVLALLEAYDITDIVNANANGVFVNNELQALYDALVERGVQSEVDALKVGALIEEVDIIDLNEAMEELSNATIYSVYDNLLNGSYNHLNAFVRNLNKRGVDYTPQKLTEEYYNEIVN